MMTRFFDIIFSLIAIIALSWILIPVTLILKLTGEHEVFYTQQRVGLNQKSFGLLKFATMLKNSETMGAGTITIQNDPRVLPFGRFLRKTKINELPQLFNILVGDMSIVGPRPLHSKQFRFYEPEDQEIISSVPPGLTGFGSIFFRDEESLLSNSQDPDLFYKENITPKKAMLEKLYISQKGLLIYFKVIILTAAVVVFPNFSAHRFIGNNNFYEDL